MIQRHFSKQQESKLTRNPIHEMVSIWAFCSYITRAQKSGFEPIMSKSHIFEFCALVLIHKWFTGSLLTTFTWILSPSFTVWWSFFLTINIYTQHTLHLGYINQYISLILHKFVFVFLHLPKNWRTKCHWSRDIKTR